MPSKESWFIMENQALIQLIDHLRSFPSETEWVEFKKGLATEKEKLGHYISGLSNAACIKNEPFAYLVFGVDDTTHHIVNTTFRFKTLKVGNEELELWIRRQLTPSIRFEHFIVPYDECNHIELFRIPAAKGEPVTFRNIAYVRIGSNLTELKKYPDLSRHIYNSETDWSAQIIHSAKIEDLDSHAIAKARLTFKEKNADKSWQDSIDQWDDMTFLDKARITIRGQITNTAIILLGKPESIHFISPAVAQITWKLETEENAYEHFGLPLFLTINDVLHRIRNLKYKFFPDNQLISVEVKKYETKVILEALNNCIAHQDYSQHARIMLTEQTHKLIFENEGGFIDGTAEDYSLGKKTPKKYRNRWLADAMVNLNMIDTMGYGIKRMYEEQRKRFFPLPDYSRSTIDRVVLEIYGQTLDENYSKVLMEKNDDLTLTEVILLDKIQKGQLITEDGASLLKKKGLIEGRKPTYYISLKIAGSIDQKAEYIKNRGLKDQHYKRLILEFLERYGSARKEDIDNLLLDILPGVLDINQKKNKIRNLLFSLSKKEKLIVNEGNNRNSKWKKID